MCMSIHDKLATIIQCLDDASSCLEELREREEAHPVEGSQERIDKIDHALKRLDAAAIHIGE